MAANTDIVRSGDSIISVKGWGGGRDDVMGWSQWERTLTLSGGCLDVRSREAFRMDEHNDT